MFHCKRTRLSRRSVIKAGVLLGSAVAIGIIPKKIIKAEEIVPPQPLSEAKNKQVAFCFDEGKCIKCGECVRACQNAYKWGEDTPWRRLIRNEKNNALSMACNHCAEPACAEVCPVMAYTKRESDGIVIYNTERCVGCGYCLYACPYHAPHLGEKTGAMSKCHFCYQRQDQGQTPHCVAICPTTALTMGDMSELSKKGDLNYKGLPNPNITKPSMIAIPKK